LKTTILLLRKDAPTFVDRMNLCEKLGIIPSAQELISVRDLRNKIAHECATENLLELYSDTVGASPTLLAAVSATTRFIEHRFD